ncbi:hypothetical protein [uncultured Winogradskyella sp.]|uniref:hypothetical protein n=1 Tax=uncultured Winogradskyella sp. TaxID=395353 RepID=UPI0026216F5E|nr:hypothetical protein [uncultured Winogradskyella sp.]
MIQPNELRVGNYVKGIDDAYIDRDNKINENIFRVSLIAKDVVKLDIGFDAVQRYERNPIISPSLKELKPIPLTEQWLIDFGFENKYCDDEDNPIYKFNSIEIVKLLFKDKFNLYASFPSIEIKHIHQLQNLYFALTGEELKLNQ